MKSRLRILLPLTLSALLLGALILSYFSYGLLTYEAYSGVGTEFVSVRGLLVVYHFDSYADDGPPQTWSCGFQEPTSREGRRLKADFDFWSEPQWWCRLGFFAFFSNTAFSGHTRVRLVVIPHWFPLLPLSSATGMSHRRSQRSMPGMSNDDQTTPNVG